MQILVASAWPGNVRQLRNLIERMVVTHTGELLHDYELPAELQAAKVSLNDSPCTLAEAVEGCERETIAAALAASDFHRDRTAKRLGISVRTLHYKMGRYGLH